jgi:hypothetical protein
VSIEDIAGDVDDRIVTLLQQAEEVSNSDTWPEDVKKNYEPESYTCSNASQLGNVSFCG